MKETSTHIYFWTGIYSNWHPCLIKDIEQNIEFSNSEQYFMYLKADFFKDEESASLILKESDPRKVKLLGRNVKNFEESKWDTVKFSAMYFVNLRKFEQNNQLKKQLFSTMNKVLVEASPYDKIWGVGLLEEDPLILDEKNWKGQNLLGICLMDVRAKLSTIKL